VKSLRQRLSYANVMSTLCFFLLVGGGAAFAAGQLAKNSVGSKQLKKNAVVTAKIKKEAVSAGKVKKDTLTGNQINESKLGTVPSSGVANSLSPLETVHLVGAAGEPAFEGGSHNFGSTGPFTLNSVGFYKDHEGIVHLQGIAETGKTSPAFVFTLPPGFRPAAGKTIIIEQIKEGGAFMFGGSTNVMGIDLSGKILGLETENPVDLDGVTFRAES
jgi:hypothetical protein